VDRNNKIIHTKYEVTQTEREDIISSLGDAAFMLYQYYLRCASMTEVPMEDANAANYFKWSIRKVARARKLLETAGYFKKITYSSSVGKKAVTYYISKNRVANM